MKIKIRSIIFFFILIGTILSFYSYYEDLILPEICLFDQGCSIVRHSEYATLFGMKVSLLGSIAFVLYMGLFLLAGKRREYEKLFLIATLIGGAFSVYFIYTQLVILKAICSTCILIDITMLIIAALVLFTIRR